jgi:hypothetical protein
MHKHWMPELTQKQVCLWPLELNKRMAKAVTIDIGIILPEKSALYHAAGLGAKGIRPLDGARQACLNAENVERRYGIKVVALCIKQFILRVKIKMSLTDAYRLTGVVKKSVLTNPLK